MRIFENLSLLTLFLSCSSPAGAQETQRPLGWSRSWLVDIDTTNEIKRIDMAAGSCAFSVNSETTSAGSCSSRCSRSCGLVENTRHHWLTRSGASARHCAGLAAQTCIVPIGVSITPKITHQQTQTSYFDTITTPSADFRYDGFLPNAGSARTYTSQKYLQFNESSLINRIANPDFLTFASIKIASELGNVKMCGQISLAREVPSRIAMIMEIEKIKYDHLEAKNGDKVYWPTSGRSVPFGNCRIADTRREPRPVANRLQHTEDFHPLLQQHYLRELYGESMPGYDSHKIPRMVRRNNISSFSAEELTISVTRQSTGPFGKAEVPEQVGKDAEGSTKYELELFSGLSWLSRNAPECAKRPNCSSCTVDSRCAWCDMSLAAAAHPLVEWSGWHGSVGSHVPDGSACGPSPHACALMGGTPVVDSCRPFI